MSARLDRLVIAVRDIDAAVELYTTLFGGIFRRSSDAADRSLGVRVAVNMDVGIELLTPVEGAENLVVERLHRFLAEKGDGIFGAGMRIDSTQDAIDRAERAGIKPLFSPFQLTPEQLEVFGGAIENLEETVLDSDEICGASFGLNLLLKTPG
jgi:catechol 2,3-dioxygenase-like lactoylglutathione lyase family enzyme